MLQELYNDLYFHLIHSAMAEILMKKLYSTPSTSHDFNSLDSNFESESPDDGLESESRGIGFSPSMLIFSSLVIYFSKPLINIIPNTSQRVRPI